MPNKAQAYALMADETARRITGDYLEEHRPGLYTRLILSGRLMEHLQEIEETAQARLESLMSLMAKQAGATEELKARDQMTWVGLMNNLRNQAEEMIRAELIYA